MRLEQLAASEHPALFECGGVIFFFFFFNNLIFLLGNAANTFLLKVFFETLIKSAKWFWEMGKLIEYMRHGSSCNLTWVWKKELGGLESS